MQKVNKNRKKWSVCYNIRAALVGNYSWLLRICHFWRHIIEYALLFFVLFAILSSKLKIDTKKKINDTSDSVILFGVAVRL